MQEYFKDKKVTVMGLGLLGRGVGDAAYIAEAGAAEVVVTDLKTEKELVEPFNRLKDLSNITWRLGEHSEKDFENKDLILVSADVHYQSPYLAHARAAGVRLAQSAALFAELSGIPIIGVTGTRGKSTVTHLIHHVLERVSGEKVLLGGNIRGVSNLQLLKEVREDSLCVMELDSWQLQGWGWAQRSPDIAVFTNFMPDHINYYQRGGIPYDEALKQYFADKANIFRYQEESGVLVTVPEVFTQAQTYASELGITLGQEVVLADPSLLPEDGLLAMPGEHNRYNAALAYAALRALSLEDSEIFPAFSSFRGVPGRLEYCGVVKERVVYNDNNATTPQATIAGLEAVGQKAAQKVILIAGGAYKELDPTPLVAAITQYCGQVILLPGTGTNYLIAALETAGVAEEKYQVVDSLEVAVTAGLASGEPGHVLLFSPGFASFGLFKNEYERNDEFMDLLEKQKEVIDK